jgi:hypothetical protein
VGGRGTGGLAHHRLACRRSVQRGVRHHLHPAEAAGVSVWGWRKLPPTLEKE